MKLDKFKKAGHGPTPPQGAATPAGGVGGYFLARTPGLSKADTGSSSAGFLFFAALVALGFIGLVRVKSRWRAPWGALSGARV